MTEQRSTILIVEDDRHTRTFLADNLTADGYEPDRRRHRPRGGCACWRRATPTSRSSTSALPDGDGLDLLARVREADGVASRIDPRCRCSC